MLSNAATRQGRAQAGPVQRDTAQCLCGCPSLVQMAYLALRQSKLSRSRRSNLDYAAKLFKCALWPLLHCHGAALATGSLAFGRAPRPHLIFALLSV